MGTGGSVACQPKTKDIRSTGIMNGSCGQKNKKTPKKKNTQPKRGKVECR